MKIVLLVLLLFAVVASLLAADGKWAEVTSGKIRLACVSAVSILAAGSPHSWHARRCHVSGSLSGL